MLVTEGRVYQTKPSNIAQMFVRTTNMVHYNNRISGVTELVNVTYNETQRVVNARSDILYKIK